MLRLVSCCVRGRSDGSRWLRCLICVGLAMRVAGGWCVWWPGRQMTVRQLMGLVAAVTSFGAGCEWRWSAGGWHRWGTMWVWHGQKSGGLASETLVARGKTSEELRTRQWLIGRTCERGSHTLAQDAVHFISNQINQLTTDYKYQIEL